MKRRRRKINNIIKIFSEFVTFSLKQIAAMDGPESWELAGSASCSAVSIIAGSIG